jgi:predicted metal-dependent HD superfamily phosphohydrolase
MSMISGRIRDELVRAYSAPDRHYHSLAHIEAMLALMRAHEGALSDPTSVEAAIWFHDAIYDTRRQDNEEKSAELATERLAGLLSPDRIDRIARMIRATAGHVVPEGLDDAARRDCAFFLDIDSNTAGCPRHSGSRAGGKCCKRSWPARQSMRARHSARAMKRRRARI